VVDRFRTGRSGGALVLPVQLLIGLVVERDPPLFRRRRQTRHGGFLVPAPILQGVERSEKPLVALVKVLGDIGIGPLLGRRGRTAQKQARGKAALEVQCPELFLQRAGLDRPRDRHGRIGDGDVSFAHPIEADLLPAPHLDPELEMGRPVPPGREDPPFHDRDAHPGNS